MRPNMLIDYIVLKASDHHRSKVPSWHTSLSAHLIEDEYATPSEKDE